VPYALADGESICVEVAEMGAWGEVAAVGDEVGVVPERLGQVASALEHLRDVLAVNVPIVVSTMQQYWADGTGQPVSLAPLRQAQARSVEDAADMRARANLAQAWMDNPANIDVVSGGVAYIPWDGKTVSAQDARLEAQDLAAAEKSGNRAEILAVEQDINDHIAEGSAGLPYLAAFYDQAAPQVANLAAMLYSQGGTLKQPLSVQDQQILNSFATGLAGVMKNGTGNVALTRQAMSALTNAPDMWSMAMLVKYGPGARAYGTSPDGQGPELLQAVSNATVQISPHVIVPANDPAVPELRAAWAWASKRHIFLATSAGDVEFSRWVEIATVSPYKDLFKGQLYQEFSSMRPDYRIGGAFNQNEKVLLATAGSGAVVFFNDPKSLLGANPEEVQKLIPEGFTGPKPLNKGPGWRYNELKTGRMIAYEEGDPTKDLGQPDSLLHQGPYYRIAENGYVYRIAAPGNPALNDPDAVTISIMAPDKSKVYINVKIATDDPEDGDGGGGDLGEGVGGGGAEGGAADG
jgi:hypothetical protein